LDLTHAADGRPCAYFRASGGGGTTEGPASTGGIASTGGPTSNGETPGTGGPTGGSGEEGDAETSSATTGVRFDLAEGHTTLDDDGGSGEGCERVDFLFVVDSSGSMAGRQISLINSFGPFIDTMYDTLEAQDFRIMTVDSDANHDVDYTCDPCTPDQLLVW